MNHLQNTMLLAFLFIFFHSITSLACTKEKVSTLHSSLIQNNESLANQQLDINQAITTNQLCLLEALFERGAHPDHDINIVSTFNDILSYPIDDPLQRDTILVVIRTSHIANNIDETIMIRNILRGHHLFYGEFSFSLLKLELIQFILNRTAALGFSRRRPGYLTYLTFRMIYSILTSDVDTEDVRNIQIALRTNTPPFPNSTIFRGGLVEQMLHPQTSRQTSDLMALLSVFDNSSYNNLVWESRLRAALISRRDESESSEEYTQGEYTCLVNTLFFLLNYEPSYPESYQVASIYNAWVEQNAGNLSVITNELDQIIRNGTCEDSRLSRNLNQIDIEDFLNNTLHSLEARD